MHTNRRQLLGGGIAGIGFSLSACSPSATQKLNFFNYDTYIGANTLKDFHDATGISVNLSLFASGDELFAKMKAGASGYDVIAPNHSVAVPLIQSGLLQPLDHTKIPNMINIAPDNRDPAYDRGNRFTIPYTNVYSGIAYRKSKMPSAMVPNSYRYLFDSSLFKGRIALSDSKGTLYEAAKYLGYSLSDLTPAALNSVEALLTRQIKSGAIKAFHQDNGQDLLLSREVDIVNEDNGDIAQITREDPDIGFVIPDTGDLLYTGTLAIPKESKRVEGAHKFLNFILDGKAGAEIARTIMYATPNTAARALMPDEYKNNPIIFPSVESLKLCEYAPYPGPETVQSLEDMLTRLRAAAR